MGAIRNSKVAMMSHTRLSEGQAGTDNFGKARQLLADPLVLLGSFLLTKNDDLGNAIHVPR